MRLFRRLFGPLCFVFGLSLVACGGSNTSVAVPPAGPTGAPPTAGPPTSSPPTPTPTPGPTLTPAPVTATVTLPPIVPGTQPAPIVLPTTAGSGASVQLPAAGVTIPAGTTVQATTSLGPISTLPFSVAGRVAQSERFKTLVPGTALLYGALTPSNQVTIGGQISINFAFATALSGSLTYYIGVIDAGPVSAGPPVFAAVGPGALNSAGTLLAFTYNATPAAPLILKAGELYGYVVYAVAGPVPTPSPTPTPTPTPTPGPFSVSPTSVALLATGQTATATISDPSSYSGAYSVTTSNAQVATASVAAKTVTISGVAAGTATVTVADTTGRSATVAVTVTTTTVPIK